MYAIVGDFSLETRLKSSGERDEKSDLHKRAASTSPSRSISPARKAASPKFDLPFPPVYKVETAAFGVDASEAPNFRNPFPPPHGELAKALKGCFLDVTYTDNHDEKNSKQEKRRLQPQKVIGVDERDKLTLFGMPHATHHSRQVPKWLYMQIHSHFYGHFYGQSEGNLGKPFHCVIPRGKPVKPGDLGKPAIFESMAHTPNNSFYFISKKP